MQCPFEKRQRNRNSSGGKRQRDKREPEFERAHFPAHLYANVRQVKHLVFPCSPCVILINI